MPAITSNIFIAVSEIGRMGYVPGVMAFDGTSLMVKDVDGIVLVQKPVAELSITTGPLGGSRLILIKDGKQTTVVQFIDPRFPRKANNIYNIYRVWKNASQIDATIPEEQKWREALANQPTVKLSTPEPVKKPIIRGLIIGLALVLGVFAYAAISVMTSE